jgi:hypothetical protein
LILGKVVNGNINREGEWDVHRLTAPTTGLWNVELTVGLGASLNPYLLVYDSLGNLGVCPRFLMVARGQEYQSGMVGMIWR